VSAGLHRLVQFLAAALGILLVRSPAPAARIVEPEPEFDVEYCEGLLDQLDRFERSGEAARTHREFVAANVRHQLRYGPRAVARRRFARLLRPLVRVRARTTRRRSTTSIRSTSRGHGREPDEPEPPLGRLSGARSAA
jgi:hypothetical protein